MGPTTRIGVFFTAMCLCCLVLCTSSAALPLHKRATSSLEVPPPEIIRFMRRFGYLEPSPNDSESLYHESAIVAAIRNVQKYGALNQTGQLDDETLSLFSKPRCGVPDIEGISHNSAGLRKKRFVMGARPWNKRRIRYFIANWSLKMSVEQVERDLARALALWSQFSGLRFERINNTSADIIVGFGTRYHGDNFPFDGAGNILAHAYYPYEMGSWGGDLHFDEDENWRENATDLGSGVDFYSVALHELGHSLGLAHSPIYTSIMFPYYKGPQQATLDTDDTLAMYEMYLNKNLEERDTFQSAEHELFILKNQTNTLTTTTTNSPMDTTEAKPTFHGDFETISQHKTRYAFLNTANELFTATTPRAPVTQSLWPATTARVRKPIQLAAPNICQGHFDVVTVLNSSVHIFKKAYVWKLTDRYTVAHGYPQRLHRVLPFLSQQVKQVDAAYVRYDNAGVLFAGQFFWVFNGSVAIEDSPRPLSDLIGNATNVTKVDAAMLWPKNNRTYLFTNGQFWRYNDQLRLLDEGYPKSMQRWHGIPKHIDAAATLSNGKTYFFKDNLYWLYNNTLIRPERGYPKRASTAWLRCSSPTKPALRNFNTTVSFISASPSVSTLPSLT